MSFVFVADIDGRGDDGTLYLLTNKKELKQLKLGNIWSTLQKNIKSFTLYDFNIVEATDGKNVTRLYTTVGVLDQLAAIPKDYPIYALDPPEDELAVRATARLQNYPDVQYYSSPESIFGREMLALSQVSTEFGNAIDENSHKK